jgi:hypothetical protein
VRVHGWPGSTALTGCVWPTQKRYPGAAAADAASVIEDGDIDVRDDAERSTTIIARLASDPFRLRRWSLFALGVLALMSALGQLLGGFLGGMLLAVPWVAGPLVALGIGAGDAFLIQYGRARRRVLLTLVAGVLVAIGSCAALASIDGASPGGVRGLLEAGLYALFFAVVILALAAAIALAIGRGGDYLARRIERLGDDDW